MVGRHRFFPMMLFSVSFFSCLSSATAQTSVQRARVVAQQAVQGNTGDRRLFSILRREDLEQVLQSVRPPSAEKSQGDILIFEVREKGYRRQSNYVSYFFGVPGDGNRFVAVLSKSLEAFRIGGFQDSQGEFNRLAKSCQVKLSTDFQAREYAKLYLDLDPMNYRLTETPTFLLLKQLAEKKFAERDGDFLMQGKVGTAAEDKYKRYLVGEEKFESWWDKNRESLAYLPFAEETTKAAEGFDVNLLTLSDLTKSNPDAGPTPLRVTLHFSRNGEVANPILTPVDSSFKASGVRSKSTWSTVRLGFSRM